MKLGILGGGPAGLSVAYYAHRAGVPFALYERSDTLGGMCRTFEHGEHRFDAGAHRFHDRDPDVTSELRALMGEELRSVRAPSQVWVRGRFLDFPPTPINALKSYGPIGAVRIAFELLAAMRNQREVVTFEDHACNRYGETLARELLLNYSEKLWGLPAAQLSPDVATRRLQGMTFRTIVVELLAPKRKSKHIDGEFLYPRRGYGAIAERLAAALPRPSVCTDHDVTGLELRDHQIRAIHFRDRPTVEVQGRLVCTLPLTLLVKMLGNAVSEKARTAASELQFRHLRLVFLRLAQERVSHNASIYIPEANYCVSRVYEPKNRSPEMAPPHETALVAEIPCFSGDHLAKLSDEALASRVIGELDQIGIAKRERVLDWRHVHLASAYPVYSMNYSDRVQTILDALSEITNLDTVGRAGTFFYSHLHDQMRFGRDYISKLSSSPRN